MIYDELGALLSTRQDRFTWLPLMNVDSGRMMADSDGFVKTRIGARIDVRSIKAFIVHLLFLGLINLRSVKTTVRLIRRIECKLIEYSLPSQHVMAAVAKKLEGVGSITQSFVSSEYILIVIITAPCTLQVHSRSNLRKSTTHNPKISNHKGIKPEKMHIVHGLKTPNTYPVFRYLLYTVPLQFLAYDIIFMKIAIQTKHIVLQNL
ncbi:hypothetical protein BTN49_1986 [Candidatus Enterovibrio escicola]|uniref:Uncharacterized protein n=1 Tax=Candidatus Enterovibrio escicola TaxID=1927127 RepID=A0A2A5T2V4_9GAMM|nr:hypothetical protein BTN49_1986 [Candidatus Enterovibrio escacola]